MAVEGRSRVRRLTLLALALHVRVYTSWARHLPPKPVPNPTHGPLALPLPLLAAHTPRVSQEVSVLFNLCNEPWLKYTLSAIADRGMKHAGWTSARLRGEVLFLETNRWVWARGQPG